MLSTEHHAHVKHAYTYLGTWAPYS